MANKVTIKVKINDIVYPVTCEAGEEKRLIECSNEVNKAIDELSNISSGISETRLLAMTALILANKLIEKDDVLENYETSSLNDTNLQNINELLDWLTNATERMNKVANLLETK